MLYLCLAVAGCAYLATLLFTPILAPYRFPVPYAVPIFDIPFALVASGIAYLCLERHRVRGDARSVALGSTLWLTALLAIGHVVLQPDYPGAQWSHPGSAPYLFFLSYLAGFAGIAVAAHVGERRLALGDRAAIGLAVVILVASVIIACTAVVVRPLLPPLVMKPGRLTPFAIWLAASTTGLIGLWALWSTRKRLGGQEPDWFARFLLAAGFIWLVGLTGFLIFPYRYSIAWYVAGTARPVGVVLIFVGLMREQASLYREVARHNVELAAREQLARADATASEERFRDLVQDIDAIVWEADAAGRVVFISQRAETILGYRVSQWVTEPDLMERHIHPDDRARALGCFRSPSDVGESQDFEYRAVTASGQSLWLRAMVHAVRDREGRLSRLRGLTLDITARKVLEQQLQQAQKMEAVGRLAGGVAHDFNNLLTVIMSQTELLAERVAAEAALRKDVAVIERAASRGAELTRQLMAFGRKQVFQPRVVDLNDLVVGAGTLLRRVIGEDITVAMLLAPSLAPVKGDPGQLEQVIMNLAVNARDAMPQGGRLTIETANVEVDAAASVTTGLALGSYVSLSVMDGGGGMDAATLARIFEPFFTTKPPGKGTGLGLTTVYGIVRQSGGTVLVDSALGQGSTFKIYLPRASEPAPEPESRRTPGPARRGSETILLVEDEEEVRRLAHQALARNGYTVLEAGDGVEGLAVAARQAGPIHLLVTDVVMPRMGGRELAERLKRDRETMRVLYMSGYTDDEVVHRMASEHPTAFLQKPFTVATLTGRVRETLDAAAPVSAAKRA